PTPQVAYHLGDLERVTGCELLQIRLVTPRPVCRLLGVRRTQDVEDLSQALLSDDFTNADNLGVLGGNPHRQVTLRDPEDEVLLLLALDDPGLDCLDECGPVVGVDNGLADTKSHRFETPFAVSRVTRVNPLALPEARALPQVRDVDGDETGDKTARDKAHVSHPTDPHHSRPPAGDQTLHAGQ